VKIKGETSRAGYIKTPFEMKCSGLGAKKIPKK
jgi:hypothetical protein